MKFRGAEAIVETINWQGKVAISKIEISVVIVTLH